jgi:FMN-dependent NADH-azoreductase
VFLDSLAAHHPKMQVDVVDLFDSDLPALAGNNIEAKYTLLRGQPIDKDHEESWRQIETLIQHFLTADAYVISTPMWNFGIPYTLKYYIDCLVQPGYVFGFNETGVVPMVHGKRMVCVTARGSDYSLGTPLHAYDFQEPYLRSIFGFIGITDIEFISDGHQCAARGRLRDRAEAGAKSGRFTELERGCPHPVSTPAKRTRRRAADLKRST